MYAGGLIPLESTSDVSNLWIYMQSLSRDITGSFVPNRYQCEIPPVVYLH